MIGKIISHYRIIEQIGQGGMGVVYKASDTRLLREVAVKILPSHLVADEKNLLRFTQEARAASALNHPNICTIHETDEHDGIHFIVMEFVDGENLRQVLERRGSLPEPEVIAIGMKVADALKAAHAKGIIHRDIKPENIMISREGYVKVMDFGLAKLKDSTSESSWEIASASSTSAYSQSYRTSVSSFLGTSAYMSPEQIEKKPVDERSDIFSLGVVLYELLTGSPPFMGKDNWEVMQAILQDTLKPPSHFISVKTNTLDAPILKALAKEPSARHANSVAFSLELAKIQAKRTHKTTRRNAMVMVSFLLLTSIIILVIITSGVLKTPTASSPPLLKVYPIGITSESEEWPSFAPDGYHLIYSSRIVGTSSSFDIWIKDIRSGMIKLLLPKKGFLAELSPDGKKIAFVNSRQSIVITDTSGNDFVQVTDRGFYPKWSPDGQQITFCDRRYTEIPAPNAVFLYDLAQKTSRQVSPRNGLKFALPEWSPDGRWIVCLGGEGSLWEIWLIETATGQSRQVSDYKIWMQQPIWHPSGEFIYFLSNQNGPYDVWRVPVDLRNGRLKSEPVQITSGMDVVSMDISPDGEKLVFTRSDIKAKLWQIPVSKTLSKPWQEAKLVMANLGPTENIEISPDGTKLVLETLIGGVRSLVLKSLVDGSESFLYHEQPAFAPSWSADGRWIAFDAGGGNNADIYRVPVAGGAAEKIIASPKADWLPTYSPDDKQICFVSNRSGQFDLWVQNLSTSETTQLTNSVEPELRGAWSHDGQKLAYFQNSATEFGWRIWIHDFSVKNADELFYSPQDNRVDILGKIVWKQDDSAVYFTPSWPGLPLMEISIISKKVNKVFETETKGMTLRRSGFTIFKESGYFIFQEGAIDIWMAEGLK